MTDCTKLSKQELIHRLEAAESALAAMTQTGAADDAERDSRAAQESSLPVIQPSLVIPKDRYGELFDPLPLGYLCFDPKGRIRDLNLAAARLLGEARSRLPGRSLSEFIAEEHVGPFTRSLRRVFQDVSKISTVLDLKGPDGEATAVRMESISACADAECHSVIIDVTEQQRTELALRAREERLALALESASDGLWDWNNQTGEVYYSPRWQTMLDYDPGEIAPVYDSWAERVHPQDWEAVKTVLDAHLAGDTPDYEVDHRLRTKSGDWKWILSRGKVAQRDEAGRPLRTVGTHVDVSYRKQLEEDLRLRDRALEATGVGVLITDPNLPDNPIVYANPAFERMTGYGREETVGRNCRFLQNDDREQPGIDEMRHAVEQGKDCRVEVRNYRKDGSLFWSRVSISPVIDDRGVISNFVGIQEDVSQYRHSAEALRDSEQRLRQITETVPDILYRAAVPGFATTYVSPALTWNLGFTPAEFIADPGLWEKQLHAADRARVLDELERAAEGGDEFSVTYRIWHKDGRTLRCMEDRGSIERDDAGQAVACFGAMNDVTAQKQAEQTLIASEARYRAIVEDQTELICRFKPDGTLQFVNDAYCRYFGKLREDLIGKSFMPLIPEQDRAQVPRHIDSLTPEHPVATHEHRVMLPTGEMRWNRWTNRAIVDKDGIIGEFQGAGRDITEQKLAEQALRDSEERLGLAQSVAGIGAWDWDIVANAATCSETYYRLYGLEPFSQRVSFKDWQGRLHPEDRARAVEETARCLEHGDPYQDEFRVIWPDGTAHWLISRGKVFRDEAQSPIRMIGVNMDVTERKRTEQDLRESERHLARAQEVGHIGSWVWAFEANEARWSDEMYRIFGHEPGSVTPGYELVIASLHPEDRERVKQAIADAREAIRPYEAEYRIRRPDGSTRWLHSRAELEMAADGSPVRLVGVTMDITEPQLAKAEQERLQRELQQAQKMEAIGQLAGGIAHDFNNILAIILGYAGLSRTRFDTAIPPKLDEYLTHIETAGQRARDLVAQLLSFSRGGETKPAPLSLQPLLKETVKMLQTTMTADIAFETEIEPDTPPVLMDPARFQQLVMNLCLNARDAMGGRGSIHLHLKTTRDPHTECSACHRPITGERVELAVSDTGTGLTPELIQRIFDPFFTTKEVGKGTGMGLSMVRGILERLGGHVLVESRPGECARFRLLFPVATAEGGPMSDDDAGAGAPTGCESGGRILVVDDEAPLTEILTEILETHGHEAIPFTDSRQALALLENDPRAFDLLIVDQTMPGLTGSQLADRMRRLAPEVPVILCTGYSEHIDKQRAKALGMSRFFEKPVNSKALLDAVQELLGEARKPH